MGFPSREEYGVVCIEGVWTQSSTDDPLSNSKSGILTFPQSSIGPCCIDTGEIRDAE
jgi:hypothetical protein